MGFIINGAFGGRFSKTVVSWVACLAIFSSFLVAAGIFYEFLQLPAAARVFERDLYPWIASGEFRVAIGFRLDALSVLMCLVVTGVGFLIHVYSVGYMHDDPGFRRFFVYLNLFVFMMLLLVTGNNLLVMFVGWEGVGLCSYLLIGFWYEKDSASDAGKKAFIVNRVGDFGFLIGIFLLFVSLGAKGVWTLNFAEIGQNAHLLDGQLATIITLLFFVGAVGKSAQIPLYVWLPDAMEGPTPVSSLIHAATMVTAGVYMIARLNFLYSMAPDTLLVVAIIGVLTAFFAASIGFAQNDIKKILAYSTISQLGFMFIAMGVGAYAAGIFHLMTHAFFKGLLFLGAGSVMHAMSGELDMRNMGGLREKTPDHLLDVLHRLPRHRGHSRLLRVLQQGRDPLEGLKLPAWASADLAPRRRDGGDDGLLHVPPLLRDVPRHLPGLRRGQAPHPRIAPDHDRPAHDPRRPVARGRLRGRSGAAGRRATPSSTSWPRSSATPRPR